MKIKGDANLARLLLFAALLITATWLDGLRISSAQQNAEVQVQEVQAPQTLQTFQALANVIEAEVVEMEALVTAYSPSDPGVDSVTYSGLPVAYGVVAVDPDVIPLGSIVHVPDYGYAVALDIGAAVHGRHIDVYLPSRKQALEWGRKQLTVKVYQVNYGR